MNKYPPAVFESIIEIFSFENFKLFHFKALSLKLLIWSACGVQLKGDTQDVH